MIEQKKPQRGKDFLIGFIPSLLIALVFLLLLFTSQDLRILTPLITIAMGLFIIAIVAFIRQRIFIGFGILTVLVATPLLLIGSCFALFAFNQ